MDSIKLVKTIIVLAILIAGLYFGTQYYVDNKDEKLRNEIKEQINEVFNGKDIVCDGDISSVQVVKQDELMLLRGGRLTFANAANGEDCSDLKTYYKKMNGGFEIIVAQKGNQYIDILTQTSSNMGYKFNIDRYNANPEGYLPIPTIDDAYKSAFNYLTSDNAATTGYRAGMYQSIKNLATLSNAYYSMTESSPLSFGSGAEVHNGYWKVFYTSQGNRYLIKLDNDKKQKDFWQIFGISTVVIILLSFVFLYKPKKKENEN